MLLYNTHQPAADKDPAASQVQQQMQMQQMGMGNPLGGGDDPDKQFQAEIENLDVVEHRYILSDVEDRVLDMLY